MKNKILTLELGDGGEEHTIFKILCAAIQIARGHKISSGRQYAKALGIIPDLVDRNDIVIPLGGGKKRKTTIESWIEIVDKSDRHIENNPVVKRWIQSGGLQDIYKIRIKDFTKDATIAEVVDALKWRLPE